MDQAREVQVSCVADTGGWVCTVWVGNDPAATTHHVQVAARDLERFAGSGVTAEHLVHASFSFLLERESRDSILRRFDLPVIGQYFPEYEAEIKRRLAG